MIEVRNDNDRDVTVALMASVPVEGQTLCIDWFRDDALHSSTWRIVRVEWHATGYGPTIPEVKGSPTAYAVRLPD